MSVRAHPLVAALAALAATGAASSPYPVAPEEKAAQYAAEVPKTILELQPFRQSQTVAIEGPDGRPAKATLIELNPVANAWLLLELDRQATDARASYHLQNPEPEVQRVRLERDRLVVRTAADEVACLWLTVPAALQQASASGLPYAPLCEGRLFLRNPVAGRRTDLERITELLRDRVWGGETIVRLVRDHLFRDAYREEASTATTSGPARSSETGPRPALLSDTFADRALVPQHLGIEVAGAAGSGQLVLGSWYPAAGIPGVHLSIVKPEAVADVILESHLGRAKRLDPIEASAIDYLVAFDLGQLDLGFALGSDHPRVGWSTRPPEAVRSASLPGPDGIGTTAPVVTNGMVSPDRLERTVATFTGGFKRQHGAFKYGDLAGRNRGSHYGFIEEGVTFSKLQPGLATLYVMVDGKVDMKTWSATDDRLLAGIRYARQNGVALVESDGATGESVPGTLVPLWGRGNWSGSAAGELRALRSGACLQDGDAGRFLIYGWFSTATPSAMARVFQAYGCRYAMLLDMNALEHTYLTVFTRDDDQIVVQHLIEGMEAVDKSVNGDIVPRFIGFPDNRDFFYIMRRDDWP